jgi:serine/threonine-protein kinase RsbW
MVVGSRFENIELVQMVVAESLNRLSLSDDVSDDIALAVREAVANAIKHGNRQDPRKRVEIEVRVGGVEVEIRITDEGKGFDPQGLPDPLAPENLMRPNGRGILFMQRFMDDIEYTFLSEGGTVVTLRKRIT